MKNAYVAGFLMLCFLRTLGAPQHYMVLDIYGTTLHKHLIPYLVLVFRTICGFSAVM
jgi:hypothetical protein